MLFYEEYGNRDAANIETPMINFQSDGDKVCVRFWYHTHGKDEFNVYYSIPDVSQSSWFRPGDVPHGWNYAQLEVSRSPPFQVSLN